MRWHAVSGKTVRRTLDPHQTTGLHVNCEALAKDMKHRSLSDTNTIIKLSTPRQKESVEISPSIIQLYNFIPSLKMLSDFASNSILCFIGSYPVDAINAAFKNGYQFNLNDIRGFEYKYGSLHLLKIADINKLTTLNEVENSKIERMLTCIYEHNCTALIEKGDTKISTDDEYWTSIETLDLEGLQQQAYNILVYSDETRSIFVMTSMTFSHSFGRKNAALDYGCHSDKATTRFRNFLQEMMKLTSAIYDVLLDLIALLVNKESTSDERNRLVPRNK